MKLYWEIAVIIAIFGGISVTSANLSLYHHLNGRDLNNIKRSHRQTTSLIKTSRLKTMIDTDKPIEIKEVIESMQRELRIEF